MSVIDSKLLTAINTVDEKVNVTNPLKDKWVSIIGDSLSSFSGWNTVDGQILETNRLPNQYSDITRVEQTWWHQLLTRCGAKLCVNCSMDGAVLVGSSSADTNCQGYRVYNDKQYCRKVGKQYRNLDGSIETATVEIVPDVVIFWIGTNDCSAKVEAGLPDDGVINSATEFNSISSATFIGTLKLLLYPLSLANSKTIKCYIMDPICKSGNLGEDGIIKYIRGIDTICDVFRAYHIPSYKYVLHSTSGDMMDGTHFHPNAKGDKEIADGCYRYICSN